MSTGFALRPGESSDWRASQGKFAEQLLLFAEDEAHGPRYQLQGGVARGNQRTSRSDPIGEDTQWQNASATDPLPEDIGYTGERKDTAAGLQYLNARYYDTALKIFTQPDWLDPNLPGVGTNRYAYAGNDPVNCLTSAARARRDQG